MTYNDWLKAAKVKQAEDLNAHIDFEPFQISPYPNQTNVEVLPLNYDIHPATFSVGAAIKNHSPSAVKEFLSLGVAALSIENKIKLEDFAFIDFSLLKSFFTKDSWQPELLQLYKGNKDVLFYLPHEIAENQPMVSSGFSAKEAVFKGANKTLEIACILYQLASAYKQGDINHLHIELYNDSEFFLDIAKVRALRFLVASMQSELGVKQQAPYIHIHFNPFYYSLNEENTNILRQGSALFSALTANCQSFSASEFNHRSSTTASSRRLLATMQWLLKEESHLNEVLDPASGSTYIECLSSQLAESAWDYFIKLTAGDFDLEQTLKDLYNKRLQAYKDKKSILLGTNYLDTTKQKTSTGPFLDAEMMK